MCTNPASKIRLRVVTPGHYSLGTNAKVLFKLRKSNLVGSHYGLRKPMLPYPLSCIKKTVFVKQVTSLFSSHIFLRFIYLVMLFLFDRIEQIKKSGC